MKKFIKNSIKSMFKIFNVGITKYTTLQLLLSRSNANAIEDLEFILAQPEKNASQILKYWDKSISQLRQDLFVLSQLDFKKNGYFVEFGAANGIDLSNTYLLEKEFGWTGILAEPAKCWHHELKANRRVEIETDCVWSQSNKLLKFNEVDSPWLSTIDSFSNTDVHGKARRFGKTYEVKTISLNDLLLKYKAPKKIDYLSIDTEGSEFEILSNFDFNKYQFNIITCEHNFTHNRENIFELFKKNGYSRVFKNISRGEDWYVHAP